MMTKEGGKTKIVNFMITGAGVLMLGRGHISHIVNMLSIYSTLIFPIPSLIFIYSMMGLLIYKYEPFWQEVSVISLRWPLRPVGLLFYLEKAYDTTWKYGILRDIRNLGLKGTFKFSARICFFWRFWSIYGRTSGKYFNGYIIQPVAKNK